eukprot:g12834.t1
MRYLTTLLMFCLAAAPSATAGLVNGTNSAGKGTVVDTTNNLEWIDVNHTTGLSPNQALADNPGYRVALMTDLQLLIDEFFAINPPAPSTFVLTNNSDDFEVIQNLQTRAFTDLFGFHANAAGFTESFFDDGVDDGNQDIFQIGDSSGTPLIYSAFLDLGGLDDGDRSQSTLGVWMVRVVPEPNSLALLGLLVTLACLLAGVALSPAMTASGGVVSAEFLPAAENSSYGVGGVFHAAQSFLATQSGVVEEVSILLLPVEDVGDRPDSITITITDTLAGVPNATLGSLTIADPLTPVDPSFRPLGALYTVDFSGEAVSLLAGQTYAWTVSGTGNTIAARGVWPGTYADGQGYESPDSGASWFIGPQGDFGWTLVEDPPNANMSASVDSSSQVTLTATGPVPNATDIGYQSVDGNTPATSAAGYAFDPTSSFAVAVDYDWSFTNTVGGTGIGFGIGEDGAGENSAGVAIGAFDYVVGISAGAARVNNTTLSQLPLIQFGASPTGSMHISYDATTGNITVGTGTVGGNAPTLSATLSGATVYNLWNADNDDDLLLVSVFLRSQGVLAPALTSGSTTAVFTDLRVISGAPVSVPEPSSLALLGLLGVSMLRRGGRVAVRRRDDPSKRDPRLSQSPNGLRESRLHQEALAEVLAHYEKTMALADERYEKAVASGVSRYTTRMDQLVRQLTRNGEVDAAAELQNMIFSAQQWEIAPPDVQGVHFLSDEDLSTGLSKAAGKYGSELIDVVDEAAGQHADRAGTAYKRFADQVDAERKAYLAALKRVLDIERNGGRAQAFEQVQAEIQRVSNLPRAEHPHAHTKEQGDQPNNALQSSDQDEDLEIDLFPDVKPQNGPAEDFRGFFMVDYKKADGVQTKFSYMIELSEDGGKLHAAKWPNNKGKWASRPFAITIIERRPGVIFYQHRTQGGETTIHRLTFKDGKPVRDELWWNKNTYRNGPPQEQGVAQALGTPVADLQAFADGELYADLHSTRSGNGKPESRKGKYRLLITDGVITMVGTKWGHLGGPWKPMVPRVMQVEPTQGGYILRYDKRTSQADHVFILDMPEDALPSLRVWWKSDNYESNLKPAATATLNGKWLIDLARKGFEN